jgi:hypothetical protein
MSKKVVSYLAGIPAANRNLEKPLILEYFIQGVNKEGDIGILHNQSTLLDCDLAIIQGFVHEKGKFLPHLDLRKKVIQKQKQDNKKVLIADSNLFLYINKLNPHHYHRYSFDGIFPTTGYYFHDSVNPNRWEKIKKDIGIIVKPWRKTGNHILICLQRNGGWSMRGLEVLSWIDSIIKIIRTYSSRIIIVRSHPGDYKTKFINNYKNVIESTEKNLIFDLRNAWATITYNSSPGVASAIEGIPVFVLDEISSNSQAADIANFDLSKIENPEMPNRDRWLEKIAMSHWNFEELQSGEAWNFFKRHL